MGKTLDDKNQDDEEHDDEHDDEEDKPLTQRDLDRVATKARSESRRVTEREILESLGVKDVEEAKALVEKAKAKATGESGKSKKGDEGEDDPIAAALAPFQAQLDELRRTTKDDIAELKVTNKVEKALINAGMSVTAAEKARRLVDVERNADNDEIELAIEELKEEMPELFKKTGSEEDDDDESNTGSNRNNDRNRGRTPHSNPGSSPRRRKAGKDIQSEARTLLHERHPRLKKAN